MASANISYVSRDSTRLNENIVEIHDVDSDSKTETRCIRIVHISDTHRHHNLFLDTHIIPDGDILIHSGDFGQYRFRRRFNSDSDMLRQTRDIDEFFKSLPHKLKIFVAGNHETSFPSISPVRINECLKHGVYLQDSSITYEGIKIYGTPWTSSRWYSNAAAFSVSDSIMKKQSMIIPDDTDILVSHSPPYGIRDLACMSHWKNLWRSPKECENCDGEMHLDESFARNHWGCPYLRKAVLERVRSVIIILNMQTSINLQSRI